MPDIVPLLFRVVIRLRFQIPLVPEIVPEDVFSNDTNVEEIAFSIAAFAAAFVLEMLPLLMKLDTVARL